MAESRIILLIFVFVTVLRAFGLFPYSYDRHDQTPQLSSGWRIYSGFCLASYILAFAIFCIYAIIHGNDGNADHLMDFVRISEVLMIAVMLLAIIITEQCLYTPCSSVLIRVHYALRDVFEDFLSGTATRQSSSTSASEDEQNQFFKRVVATTWQILLWSLILMIIGASIAYHKFILVLEYLPIGWNYFGMLMLIVPFVAMSLATSKVCIYVHAFDHAFQMLNRQIQLMILQLNYIEVASLSSRSSKRRRPQSSEENQSKHHHQQQQPQERGDEQHQNDNGEKEQVGISPIEPENNETNGALLFRSPLSSHNSLRTGTGTGGHGTVVVDGLSAAMDDRSNFIRKRISGTGRLYRKQKLMFEFQQLIYHTRSKYDALFLLVEEFFRHWALYMLLFLATQFALLVVEAFFLFTNVYGSIRSGQDIDQDYAILNVRACLLVVIELTWTIGACSHLMDSIQRIGVTLNGLVTLDVDAGLVQTIETWTIKLLSQPNAVQVFQLFDINNGFLYSIIGAVCGYLVILIQFKLAE